MQHAGSRAGASEADRDPALLDAVLALVAERDLHSVLECTVSAGCVLTGAGGGVLTVASPDGSIDDHVALGVDDTELAAVLGQREAPGAGGPGRATLEVPVRVRGEAFGALYLLAEPGGPPFTDGEASRVVTLAQAAGAMIGHARTFQRSERDRAWLAAAAEVGEGLQSGEGGWDRIATAARHAVDAGWALVVQPEVDRFDAVAHAGEGTPASAVRQVDEALRRADATGETVEFCHDEEPVLVVPLQARLADRSLLALAWAAGGRGPDAEEVARIAGFAESVSLALDRTQALRERQELMLVADRDRIARDLHDLVIQRLFATGLQLQGVRQMATNDGVRSRLDEAVADLDLTIRDIRSTIFELQRQREASLRAEVRALVKEYAAVLGFTPLVRTTGPIEGLPPRAADQLLATLREGLSNVARHARADACVVEVRVLEGWLTLVVSDNGNGMAPEPHESGLRNVRRRAAEIGGRMRLLPEAPQGARLEWAVPVEPGGE